MFGWLLFFLPPIEYSILKINKVSQHHVTLLFFSLTLLLIIALTQTARDAECCVMQVITVIPFKIIC